MAREDITSKWREIAAKDIEVAELTHDNGYWLYAAFLCHQALEKTLKSTKELIQWIEKRLQENRL